MNDDALVLAERLPNDMRVARILRRDVVRAQRRAEPAHAMRQARRSQPHLRVLKAFADLAQHVVARNPQVLDVDHRVPAHEARSIVSSTPRDLERGVRQIGQKHGAVAGAIAVRAMMIANAAPSAPVISHLRPLMTKPLPSGSARVLRSTGSAPAPPSGSVMAKHERTSPVASRREIFLLLRRGRNLVEQVDVAFVGRVKMQRDGPEDRITRRLEHDRLLEVREALPAVLLRRVDAEQARLFGGRVEIVSEVLRDPVVDPSAGPSRRELCRAAQTATTSRNSASGLAMVKSMGLVSGLIL